MWLLFQEESSYEDSLTLYAAIIIDLDEYCGFQQIMLSHNRQESIVFGIRRASGEIDRIYQGKTAAARCLMHELEKAVFKE